MKQTMNKEASPPHTPGICQGRQSDAAAIGLETCTLKLSDERRQALLGSPLMGDRQPPVRLCCMALTPLGWRALQRIRLPPREIGQSC